MVKFRKLRQRTFRIADKATGYNKTVVAKTFQLPNGLVETFYVDNDKDSVQVFAMMTDKTVVLVSQFRPGTEQTSLELPGGGLEPGEDAQEAAERELREETGMVGKVEFLAAVPYSPYSTGKRHMFIATDCEKVHGTELDPNEFLRVVLMEFDKFMDKVLSGTVRGWDGALLGLARLAND